MVITINEVYLDICRTFKREGISGAEIEARELICKVLKLDRSLFLQKRSDYIADRTEARIRELARMRCSGIPVQHLTGEWEFYGLDFKVTKDTLIPRADTETLVSYALDFLKGREKGRIMDLCCGTGCVGISIVRMAKGDFNCLCCDISENALKVAKENIILNRVSGRVNALACDAFAPCPGVFGSFDLIVCNPPYIPTGEIAGLDPEVRQEPLIALDGGKDGLDFYRAVCANFAGALREGGAVMFEVGLGQYGDVMEILRAAGFSEVAVYKDLAGIERVVSGKKAGEQ